MMFLIENCITGTYVCDDELHIRTFATAYDALEFLMKRGIVDKVPSDYFLSTEGSQQLGGYRIVIQRKQVW